MATISSIGGLHNRNQYLSIIEGCAHEAVAVIGLVAYWTVGRELIPNLIKLNENPNSFICVDPSSPTDLDLLHKLNEEKNNFHAFKYEASGYETKEGLLHSKVLLFDYADEFATLILGSHNMSNRALKGINIEHSICLRLKKTDNFYLDIKSQIQEIKDKYCTKIEYVKDTNGGGSGGDEKEIFVLKIVGDNMNSLMSEQIITLFYKSPHEAIKTNEQKLLILAIEAETDEEFLYGAEIKQSGSFDNFIEKSTEIEFSKRRYAEKDVNMMPFLFSERDIPDETNKKHKYFNTIQLLKKIDKYELYKYKNKNVANEIIELYGTTDSKILETVKLSSKINNQRIKVNYSTDFSAHKIKEYYCGDNSTLFPKDTRKPDFNNYPVHKKIREKMFFRKK